MLCPTPEQNIIKKWRNEGLFGSIESYNNVRSPEWCKHKLINRSTITKGELALIMEYANEKTIVEYAKKLILSMEK